MNLKNLIIIKIKTQIDQIILVKLYGFEISKTKHKHSLFLLYNPKNKERIMSYRKKKNAH